MAIAIHYLEDERLESIFPLLILSEEDFFTPLATSDEVGLLMAVSNKNLQYQSLGKGDRSFYEDIS